MQVSQFEIYRLVQRALEGLGAGYGVDRDGARAVAWLEARGLPGLAPLAADLADLEQGIRPPTLESGRAADLAIDAGGGSAIVFGGAVIDLVVGRAASPGMGQARLRLRRCRWPLFLIPTAVENAPGFAIALIWRGPEGGVMARIETDGALTLFLAPDEDLRTALLEPTTADVDIHVASTNQALPPVPSGLVAVLHRDGLARPFAQSLDHGVDVDPAIWRRLEAAAARVQVPASAESRLKGAGGGDANA